MISVNALDVNFISSKDKLQRSPGHVLPVISNKHPKVNKDPGCGILKNLHKLSLVFLVMKSTFLKFYRSPKFVDLFLLKITLDMIK